MIVIMSRGMGGWMDSEGEGGMMIMTRDGGSICRGVCLLLWRDGCLICLLGP